MPTRLISNLWSCSELDTGMELSTALPHDVKTEINNVDDEIADSL